MKTNTAHKIIKSKNYTFYLCCMFMRPFIKNFNVFAAAYSYMRWLDNIVDNVENDINEVALYLCQQKKLIERIYAGEIIVFRDDQERLLRVFIEYDVSIGSKLKKSFLDMFETLEFDLRRRFRICNKAELERYSYQMAKSFADFMAHFLDENVDNNKELITLASYGCQAYMLRDLVEDINNGLINIDQESVDLYGVNINNILCDQLLSWVDQKADHLHRKMKLIYKIINGRISFRNKIILLLFIEPRRYVVWKITYKSANPLRVKYFTRLDTMRIIVNIVRLLTLRGKEYGSV